MDDEVVQPVLIETKNGLRKEEARGPYGNSADLHDFSSFFIALKELINIVSTQVE